MGLREKKGPKASFGLPRLKKVIGQIIASLFFRDSDCRMSALATDSMQGFS